MKGRVLSIITVLFLTSNVFAQLAKGDRILAWQVDMAEDNNYDLAFANANAACMESVHLFTTWNSVEPTQGNYDASFITNFFDIMNLYYPATGTDVELQLAPVNTNVLEVPSDLSGLNLDDPILINQFKSLLDTVFAHIPDVTLSALNIGNESDIYFGSDVNAYNQFKVFLDSVGPYAKQLYFNLHGTDLKIGTTLTFHGLLDPVQGPLCATLNANLDIIATTYYPLNPDFTMENPSVVAGDFASLVAAYPSTSTPIYLVECGYASSATCNSSEALQAQFYQEVFAAWDAHYDNIKYLTVFKTNDWSQADVDQLALYYGITNVEFTEYLRTLGVRNWDGVGTKKLAYDQILCEVADRNWCSATCPNASLNEAESLEEPVCYPNPAKNTIRLSITDPEIEGIYVSDLTGREQNVGIRMENSSSIIIDVSSLPSASYFIKTPASSVPFIKLP